MGCDYVGSLEKKLTVLSLSSLPVGWNVDNMRLVSFDHVDEEDFLGEVEQQIEYTWIFGLFHKAKCTHSRTSSAHF